MRAVASQAVTGLNVFALQRDDKELTFRIDGSVAATTTPLVSSEVFETNQASWTFGRARPGQNLVGRIAEIILVRSPGAGVVSTVETGLKAKYQL